MTRELHRSIARALGCCTTIVCVAACSSPGDPTSLSSGDADSCKSTCAVHATSTCTTECETACDGRCAGSMSTNNFPEVDSIDCAGSGVQFHEGGSQLTCYP